MRHIIVMSVTNAIKSIAIDQYSDISDGTINPIIMLRLIIVSCIWYFHHTHTLKKINSNCSER